MTDGRDNPRAALTIALCTGAAFFEGADNISMGMAAPGIAAEYHFRPDQIGFCLSASLFGMMLGAMAGGRIGDRYGRKVVLIGSMLALGLFSLATIAAVRLESMLAFRFFAGLGLGAAFPTLIAISAEVSKPSFRATTISIVYCGQPVGSILLGIGLNLAGLAKEWRPIFWVGGIGPLVLAVLLAFFLQEPEGFRAARRRAGITSDVAPMSLGTVLFGEGRALGTILLWIGGLFTVFVVYLMLNWIPSLMVGKGLTRPEASMAAVFINIGAALGILAYGAAIDRGNRRYNILSAYGFLVLSLLGLVYFTGYPMMLLFCLFTGFFMLGSQVVVYNLTVGYYPVLVHGTGLGALIAVGRVGSVAAPITAGFLLNAGFGSSAVMATAIPGVIIATFCIMTLLREPASRLSELKQV